MSKREFFNQFKKQLHEYLELFDKKDKVPLHMAENRIKLKCQALGLDKNLTEKIVFKITREINKHLRKSEIVVTKNNPSYRSDWILVIGFFVLSIALLKVKNNNINRTPSNSVIGVRG